MSDATLYVVLEILSGVDQELAADTFDARFPIALRQPLYDLPDSSSGNLHLSWDSTALGLGLYHYQPKNQLVIPYNPKTAAHSGGSSTMACEALGIPVLFLRAEQTYHGEGCCRKTA